MVTVQVGNLMKSNWEVVPQHLFTSSTIFVAWLWNRVQQSSQDAPPNLLPQRICSFPLQRLHNYDASSASSSCDLLLDFFFFSFRLPAMGFVSSSSTSILSSSLRIAEDLIAAAYSQKKVFPGGPWSSDCARTRCRFSNKWKKKTQNVKNMRNTILTLEYFHKHLHFSHVWHSGVRTARCWRDKAAGLMVFVLQWAGLFWEIVFFFYFALR